MSFVKETVIISSKKRHRTVNLRKYFDVYALHYTETNSLDRFRGKSTVSAWNLGSFNEFKFWVFSTTVVPKYISYFLCDHGQYSENNFPSFAMGQANQCHSEWIVAAPQAKFTLLPINCFQVEEQISDAAQTLEVIIRNTARPMGCYSRHLLVTNPENVMLIQPPMRIIGRTLVTFPFIISVNMVGSANHKIWCKVAVCHKTLKQKQDITLLHQCQLF